VYQLALSYQDLQTGRLFGRRLSLGGRLLRGRQPTSADGQDARRGKNEESRSDLHGSCSFPRSVYKPGASDTD
jgi:hypothetical protein